MEARDVGGGGGGGGGERGGVCFWGLDRKLYSLESCAGHSNL